MKKIYRILKINSGMRTILILITMCFISCSKRQPNSSTFPNDNSVSISLPNTIKVNEELKGYIKYKSDFDSITTSFTDTTNFKIPYFYIYEPQENNIDMNNLIIRDSVKLWDNRIDISNVRFSKKGSYFFLALIKDEVMIFSYKKNGETDSIRILTNEYFIRQKILVTE